MILSHFVEFCDLWMKCHLMCTVFTVLGWATWSKWECRGGWGCRGGLFAKNGAD